MRGPLQTVVQNLTDKMLTYSFSPRLYVQPNGSYLLSFDPFTKWEGQKELERLLIDVKKGRAVITYLYDPNFVAIAPAPNVQLSLNAQRILGTVEVTPAEIKKTPRDINARPKMEGTLPPGELPSDEPAKRPDLPEDADPAEKFSRQAAAAAGISDYPEDAPVGENIEKILDEKILRSEPDKVRPAEPEAVPETVVEKQASQEAPKKGGRKKKEVVTI